jgi:hypothetical protein
MSYNRQCGTNKDLNHDGQGKMKGDVHLGQLGTSSILVKGDAV